MTRIHTGFGGLYPETKVTYNNPTIKSAFKMPPCLFVVYFMMPEADGQIPCLSIAEKSGTKCHAAQRKTYDTHVCESEAKNAKQQTTPPVYLIHSLRALMPLH